LRFAITAGMPGLLDIFDVQLTRPQLSLQSDQHIQHPGSHPGSGLTSEHGLYASAYTEFSMCFPDKLIQL